jgi:hypothetical protein
MIIENRNLSDLLPYPNNAKTHSDEQIAKIAASIKEFGFNNPVLVDSDGGIIAGHGRVDAARKLNLTELPTITLGHLTEAQKKAYILADNRLAEIGSEWDIGMVSLELEDLDIAGFDTVLTGFDDDFFNIEEELYPDGIKGSLAEQFGAPPFSVLDTRKGEWIARRNEWQAKIKDNGETRRDVLGFKNFGGDWGNSVLDACLAEVMVNWYGIPGGSVFDPFAGDTVFGYVSATQGMNFTGIELRKEQAEINNLRCRHLPAMYHCDTSANMDSYISDNSMDMIFSCPPYFDLEQYSDSPDDLSNMSEAEFYTMYSSILNKTYKKLKDDRFAVIVVGEVRGADGNYIGLVPNTIDIMEKAGYQYYNEIILINSAGTLPLRAGKAMRASRKIGKMHQNVLVFLKGNAKAAAESMGEIVESADV